MKRVAAQQVDGESAPPLATKRSRGMLSEHAKAGVGEQSTDVDAAPSPAGLAQPELPATPSPTEPPCVAAVASRSKERSASAPPTTTPATTATIPTPARAHQLNPAAQQTPAATNNTLPPSTPGTNSQTSGRTCVHAAGAGDNAAIITNRDTTRGDSSRTKRRRRSYPALPRSSSGSAQTSPGDAQNSLETSAASHEAPGLQAPATDNISCPICLDVFKQPYVTRCGHSFCFSCLERHLQYSNACPVCHTQPLTSRDTFPNLKLQAVVDQATSHKAPSQLLQRIVSNPAQLDITEVNTMLAVLLQHKRALQQAPAAEGMELCADFLRRAHRQREDTIKKLQAEMQTIESDMARLETKLAMVPKDDEPPAATTHGEDVLSGMRSSGLTAAALPDILPPVTCSQAAQEARTSKKRRVVTHFDDLQKSYLNTHEACHGLGPGKALSTFQQTLAKVTKYSRMRIFSQLKYGDLYHNPGIVFSIEFDCRGEHFATAGVAKKIRIYDYRRLAEQPHIEAHQPVADLICRSKISCVAWNPYVQSRMAGCDYEGAVSLWDAHEGRRVRLYEEHEKRSWSVDFSPTQPSCLASGSDDSKVKLWNINESHSVATIDSKANVCCVRFNPENANYLAFGSADHLIHYYDLRNLRKELFLFKGHQKAVSYVKFLNSEELVSASTDSTLKLWSVRQNELKQTFTGHSNEKNFVGLSTNGDYIACGSENNAVYAYYKALSKPVLLYRFSHASNRVGDALVDDTNNFVSSVCWRKDSNILLAANSLGVVNVMTLE